MITLDQDRVPTNQSPLVRDSVDATPPPVAQMSISNSRRNMNQFKCNVGKIYSVAIENVSEYQLPEMGRQKRSARLPPIGKNLPGL